MRILSYLFYPNPRQADYGDPWVIGLICLGLGLILASFALRYWRARTKDSMARKLSASWPSATFWFGVVALVLIVSRVEGIQFISMRVWWLLWILSVLAYKLLQLKKFRAKHYQVLPSARANDPRERYLPGKKHR